MLERVYDISFRCWTLWMSLVIKFWENDGGMIILLASLVHDIANACMRFFLYRFARLLLYQGRLECGSISHLQRGFSWLTVLELFIKTGTLKLILCWREWYVVVNFSDFGGRSIFFLHSVCVCNLLLKCFMLLDFGTLIFLCYFYFHYSYCYYELLLFFCHLLL